MRAFCGRFFTIFYRTQKMPWQNPETGRVALTTRQEQDWISFTATDNGQGFPPEVLSRAFEPYFTTKTRGTGLGLAIVKKIIDEHGGKIRLANLENGGAQVTIMLRSAHT